MYISYMYMYEHVLTGVDTFTNVWQSEYIKRGNCIYDVSHNVHVYMYMYYRYISVYTCVCTCTHCIYGNAERDMYMYKKYTW